MVGGAGCFADRDRRALLSKAPRIDPVDLVEAGERYARATGYPIQYQWTLLEGSNDGDDELDASVDMSAGKCAVMNFIPFNAGEALDFRRPGSERAREMVRQLHQRGILAKLRQSDGQDVDGGSGPLRARAMGAAVRA